MTTRQPMPRGVVLAPLDLAAELLDALAHAAQAEAVRPGAAGCGRCRRRRPSGSSGRPRAWKSISTRVRLRVRDDVADQFAQHAGQRRPLHHGEHDVVVERERPAQLDVRRGQALRQVGLPFGARRATAGGRTPPGRASASSGPAACGGRTPPSRATAPCTSASAGARRCRRAGPARAAARSSLRPCSTALSKATARRSCSTMRSARRASSR